MNTSCTTNGLVIKLPGLVCIPGIPMDLPNNTHPADKNISAGEATYCFCFKKREKEKKKKVGTNLGFGCNVEKIWLLRTGKCHLILAWT